MPKGIVNRRILRFSLRTALVVLTLFALWLGMLVAQARRQRDAVSSIRDLGGSVTYESASSVPSWLQGLVGDDFFLEIMAVDLDSGRFSEDIAVHLEKLSDLRWLTLTDSPVTDEVLEAISGARKLESLWLSNTHVTDKGLIHLRNHRNLISLTLIGTQVRGEGLAHLAELKKLQSLTLCDTPVDDKELEHAAALTGLQVLDLTGTSVTPEAIAHLQEKLPHLTVIDPQNQVVASRTTARSSTSGPSVESQ